LWLQVVVEGAEILLLVVDFGAQAVVALADI
jgi:hypothetical protein